MPVLRKAVEKSFSKVMIIKGYGFHTPQDGSVCKIKVTTDEANLVSGLDYEKTKEIIIGDVDEYTEKIIEECIRTMKEEEECCVYFKHPDSANDGIIPIDTEEVKDGVNSMVLSGNAAVACGNVNISSESVSNSEGDTGIVEVNDFPVAVSKDDTKLQNNAESSDCVSSSNSEISSNKAEIQFQLLSYTREPEIWEMSITEKWRRASYHKQRGLELYARGAYQYAFRRFGLTLKYVISLEHDVPFGQEEGMDIKGLKLSCYLNVAACQMRHHNFESVVINSSKALALQPKNAKALYRRGAAYLQLQEYENAQVDLTAAQLLEPKNQAIAKQLQILKSRVQKLNQYYASAMKKMFS